MILHNLLLASTILAGFSDVTRVESKGDEGSTDEKSTKDILPEDQSTQSEDKRSIPVDEIEGVIKVISSTPINEDEEQQNLTAAENDESTVTQETLEEEEEEEIDVDIDSYGLLMKDFYESSYADKSRIMMIQFGNYVLQTMNFDHVREENKPVTFKQRVERFNYPSYPEVFSGMYTNYTIMSSMLSLKACTIYYGNLNSVVADKCHRNLGYLKSFLEVYPIDELFNKNPLKNNKIEVPPEYVAKDIVQKLKETKEKLYESLNQNFIFIVEDIKETMEKEEIDPSEIIISETSEVPIYEPHPSLDRAYTAMWEMLLDPVKENFIIFNNYFNDAMNIHYFIESVEGFVLLPKSRPFMTTAWRELVKHNYSLTDMNFPNLVFHTNSVIEIKRAQSNVPFDENGNLNVTLPESLYTLADLPVPNKGETRYSNFVVNV